jgi:mannose-6-phosphate isomerase-like protein (cupin superfamily)
MTNTIFSKGDCLNHYKWGDDCHGWVFIDTEALSVKQELMPPDTAETVHLHRSATQVFFILKGRALINIDGVNNTLKPEQGISVEPGQEHCVSNNQSVDLEFIIYSFPSVNNDRIDIG